MLSGMIFLTVCQVSRYLENFIFKPNFSKILVRNNQHVIFFVKQVEMYFLEYYEDILTVFELLRYILKKIHFQIQFLENFGPGHQHAVYRSS